MSVENGLKIEGTKGKLVINWFVKDGRVEIENIICDPEKLPHLTQACLFANAGQDRCVVNNKLRDKFMEIFKEIKTLSE